MSAPRLLYIDANVSFINPTRNLLPVAMMAAADVVLFGPGHVSSDILARGLPAFIDAHGPFDLAASNTLVLFSDMKDPAAHLKLEHHGPEQGLILLEPSWLERPPAGEA